MTYRLGLIAWLILSFASVSLAGTFVAFDPENFIRGKGAPVTVTKSFSVLNSNTEYTLLNHNGGLEDEDFEKVSSSIIALNGVQFVGPNEIGELT